MVWISRIAPKKNLKTAIEILEQVKSNINFTIYGSIHAQEYWDECKEELKKLPDNVKWEYRGNVASEEVVETLKNYHVFLFPTLGENYGHVIQEALSAGCPVILSNQTPWNNLEKYDVGYVFPLEKMNLFAEAIEKYANFKSTEWSKLVNAAQKYAIENSNTKVEITGYRMIFDKLG